MNADRDEWQRIYQEEGTPWDLDEATPALPEILRAAGQWGLPAGARIAVPGCGLGHDAAAIQAAGFSVWGIDPVQDALRAAQSRYGAGVAWTEGDWFRDRMGPFDAVFDHAFFVAFDPVRRPEIVAAHAANLNPGGLWLGLYWHRVKEPGGRPWAVQPEELKSLARPHFQVLQVMEAGLSHPRRAGREFWMIARRHAGT